MSKDSVTLTIEFPGEVEETLHLIEGLAVTLKNAGYVGKLYYEALNIIVVFTKKAITVKEWT